MLVQAFFEWIETAHAAERAQAVTTLARAYLAGAHGGDTPEEIEAALTFALDDSSPLVRRALAMVLADRPNAPRALVLSLSRDQAEVAALLIARSPLLTEADLIDLAGSAERLSLMAIALRGDVTPRIAAAVIARGEVDALFALMRNTQAEVADGSLIDVAARWGSSARLREAMLARGALPPEARHHLMRAVAQSLGDFVQQGGFLSSARQTRAMADALEGGTLAIAARAGEALPEFVAHLREGAALTPALLLRSVLAGETRFIAASLAELCDLPLKRVKALMTGGSEAALGALVRKAGLPDFLIGAMIAALSVAVRLTATERDGSLKLGVIRAAQSAIVSDGREESLRLLALLRRYEAEAARHAARALAETLRRRAVPMQAVALGAPESDAKVLSLAVAEAEKPAEAEASAAPEAPVEAEAPATAAPEASPLEDDLPITALRGTVRDEPVPDLATLIAQWKAERAEKDALAASEASNENILAAEATPEDKEKAA